MSKKEVMRLFSKIHLLFSDTQLRYLLRNSFSSSFILRILVFTLYDVIANTIYFKLERRFKHRPWFRTIQFCGNSPLLQLMSRKDSVDLDSSKWHRIPTREIALRNIKPHQPFNINLASCNVPYNEKLFFTRFADKEDTFSAHRFKWLLLQLYEKPTQETIDLGYDVIEKWIDSFPKPSHFEVFESYSVSERLLNWLFFIIFTKKFSKKRNIFWQRLSQSYECQLAYLIDNLEYHWRFTNNHILNNARCLYICGSLLEVKDMRLIAQEILFAETDKMIRNGVLQEGSSHYQMLLTQSYLEMLYAAEFSQDYEMIKWLIPRVSQMLEVCNSLQSKFEANEYPLFGDVSPDVFPKWMLGRPFSCNNKDSPWQRLFRMEEVLNPTDQERVLDTENDLTNRWHYLSKWHFEVWICVKKRNDMSHGHPDNGSVVIFHSGNPILIDLGRFSYTKDFPNIFQCSEEGHNIPKIGNSLFDFCPSALFKTNRFSSKCEVIKLTHNSIDFVLISFDNQIELHRKLVLHDGAVTIEDSVKKGDSKTKGIEYENNWYLNSECDLRDDKVLLRTKDNLLHFGFDFPQYKRVLLTNVHRAAQYGRSVPSFRLNVSASIYNNQIVRTIVSERHINV